MRRSTVLAASLALLTLSGCAAAAPTGLGEVDRVTQVRDAFIDAGGKCKWERSDKVTNASESGTCSDSTVIMMFVTEADKKDTVATLQEFRLPGNQLTLLVGDNWIINSPEAEAMAEKLGGEWITE